MLRAGPAGHPSATPPARRPDRGTGPTAPPADRATARPASRRPDRPRDGPTALVRRYGDDPGHRRRPWRREMSQIANAVLGLHGLLALLVIFAFPALEASVFIG